MKRQFLNLDTIGQTAVSRVVCVREILSAYFCILLSESVCLFSGIVLR